MTVAGVCPQPDVSVALQVAPLITETVSPPPFPTYTVSVAGSTTMPAAPGAASVAGVCPHPAVSAALQVAALITETVSVESTT